MQMIAQSFGILIGSVVSNLVYLLLIPDPKTMLVTPQWPTLAGRYTLPFDAGLVAGESLLGILTIAIHLLR